MRIVTGRRGEPHVTSRQMQAVYRSFLGDFALLDIGNHLAATATANDNVRISDGVVAVQGIYAVIAYNEYDDNYIEPVSVGMKRIDTIILHYTKSNDIEDMQIEVVEGEEAVDNPVAPTIAEGGDAWEGTADIKVPIYDVLVTSFGLTVTPYSRMNTLIPTLDSIAERIPETVVTGVKGDSEVLYRDGNVNITKANVGLGDVDNTSDLSKPISNATQTALDLKASIDYVNATVASAYHAGGNLTVAELTSSLLVADNMGKVYNMSDSGVTTSDFVEGAGKPIREGDDVGICNRGTVDNPIYKFNLLSGFVDLSNYATTAYVDELCADDKKQIMKAFKDKYDESSIPSSYNERLYTVGNPGGMYPADEWGTSTTCCINVLYGKWYSYTDTPSDRWVLEGELPLRLEWLENFKYKIENPLLDGQVLKYNQSLDKWINANNTEIDSAMSTTSTNPLQNKVITAELAGTTAATGNPLTIESSESNLVECVAEVEPIQEGSGDPSPDNIRPISGRSEVAIQRVGKNWLNYSSDNVGWASDKTAIVDVLNSLPEGTYTLTVPFTLTSISGDITNAKCQVRIDVNFAPVSVNSKTWGSATIGTTKTITCQIVVDSSVKGKFTNCYLYGCGIDGVGARGTASVSNVQLELGTTATTYEPYAGKTYTIQLGQDVYGARYDVTRGKMVVDRGYIASYNGETLPSTWISDRDVYASGTTPTIGAEVVYELATPITIPLTPQQIRLLKGTNHISCNTGDLTIKYYPDNVLGQLKGDIEDEYDERVETLETQVQELQPSLIFMSRERRDITSDLSRLSIAVAEQNLEKYGYKIGDYFERVDGNRTYTYHIADYNTFKGTSTPYCLTTNHIGIVVDTHTTTQWYSGDASAVGYNGSTLHTYLKGTVLDNIKADMIYFFGGTTGLEHLLSHSKLLTTALANWGWQVNQYISALTCTQIDAGSQWTANGFQEGEASKSLELFRKHKWTEIFESRYPWLRNLSNSSGGSDACFADAGGDLDGNGGVANAIYVVGLIIFH